MQSGFQGIESRSELRERQARLPLMRRRIHVNRDSAQHCDKKSVDEAPATSVSEGTHYEASNDGADDNVTQHTIAAALQGQG